MVRDPMRNVESSQSPHLQRRRQELHDVTKAFRYRWRLYEGNMEVQPNNNPNSSLEGEITD